MFKTIKAARSTLKIAAVYAFALSTAVACSKFEGNTVVRGTNRGAGQVTQEGTPGPVADSNVSINSIQTVFLGANEFDEFAWSLKTNVTHGSRTLEFDIYPSVNPFNQDSVQKTVGTLTYVAQGVCGNESCSQFAVLINVTDESNGTDLQKVEYWNLHVSNTTPQNRLTNTAFRDVTEAYETLSRSKLP